MAEALVSPDLHKILSPDYPKGKIKKVDLNLEKIEFGDKIAYLLKNVFSKEECEALIEHTESLGYTPALIHFGDNAIRAVGYRDSQRVMIDDKEFVKILFDRIGHYLPQQFRSSQYTNIYKLVEINERLRFLKYLPGDSFKHHYDGQYERPDRSAITQVTLQIYLNEGMKGGETTFLRPSVKAEEFTKPENRVPVKPKPGQILVFEHRILHEGTKVQEGLKYTIRCDVLYTYDQEANEKEKKQEQRKNCAVC